MVLLYDRLFYSNHEEIKHLRGELVKINREHSSNITVEQAISIRNIVIKDKIIKNYQRMNSKVREIAEQYDEGAHILDLSDKYDFPPLNLLRGIFLHNGYDSSKVYAVFADKEDPTFLQSHDLKQYRAAVLNDAEATFNQKQIAKVALDNETKIIQYFRDCGIGLKTQDDLVKEQMQEHGRAVSTPDILFTSTVHINGVEVKWIDYKDYCATPTKFLFKSNSEQAAKYNKKFGTGALCYRLGVVNGVEIKGTMLLNASMLPVRFDD